MPFESQRPELVLDEETKARLEGVCVSYTVPAVHVERARGDALVRRR